MKRRIKQRLCPVCYEPTDSKLGVLAPPELHYREHNCLKKVKEMAESEVEDASGE